MIAALVDEKCRKFLLLLSLYICHQQFLIRSYTVNVESFSINYITRMWADAQRDGHHAEYRWRHLFNTAKFG